MQTVNGYYGPTVTLITNDIAENSNSNADALVDETTTTPVYSHNRYIVMYLIIYFLLSKLSIIN